MPWLLLALCVDLCFLLLQPLRELLDPREEIAATHVWTESFRDAQALRAHTNEIRNKKTEEGKKIGRTSGV